MSGRTPLKGIENAASPAPAPKGKWATTVLFSPVAVAGTPNMAVNPRLTVADDTHIIELKPFAPKECVDFGEVSDPAGNFFPLTEPAARR